MFLSFNIFCRHYISTHFFILDNLLLVDPAFLAGVAFLVTLFLSLRGTEGDVAISSFLLDCFAVARNDVGGKGFNSSAPIKLIFTTVVLSPACTPILIMEV